MKKKFLTVAIVLLAVMVFTVLFVPKTTRVTAKLENDNAQILQVDIKSKDFLFLEDKATGKVSLTIDGDLITYYPVGDVVDINELLLNGEVEKYPLEISLTRRDRTDDDRSVSLYFDKNMSCFVLKIVGGELYRFADEIADENTVKMIEDYIY